MCKLLPTEILIPTHQLICCWPKASLIHAGIICELFVKRRSCEGPRWAPGHEEEQRWHWQQEQQWAWALTWKGKEDYLLQSQSDGSQICEVKTFLYKIWRWFAVTNLSSVAWWCKLVKIRVLKMSDYVHSTPCKSCHCLLFLHLMQSLKNMDMLKCTDIS